MNINRHNYEEFFLLYIDRELSGEERVMVETFVAANPDLKEELELLQQTTFTADTVVAPQLVQSLLKSEIEEPSISEELLLLHLDKELTAEQTAQVEQALQKDEKLQKDFRWLQRSQLTADENIVFPDKSLLYRDAEPARVFHLGATSRRWAAAAAVIVLLASGMWLMNSKQELNNNNLAVAKPETQNPSSSTVPKVEQQSNNQSAETKSNDVSTEPQKQDLAVTTVHKHTTDPSNSSGNTNNTQTTNTQTQNPVTHGEDVVVTQPVLTPTENNSSTNSNIQETVNVPPVTNTANRYASYASYNEDNDNQEEDNSVLNEERQRSTGLKGLLKKAKRTLERRAGIHTGDSQVRFAVFAVNTQ